VVFAFQVLPIVIFIASFFSPLCITCGVMQWGGEGHGYRDAKGHGRERRRILNVAASIFMGQTEAPLTINVYRR